MSGPELSASPRRDRMWPLDLAIAAIVGLILLVALNQLPLTGDRWQSSGLTYLIALPILGVVMSLVSRLVANRYVQKSLQLGMLFSVFLHLTLVVLAVNVVVFSPYLAESLTGEKPRRTPVRKTIPEYLFQTPPQKKTAADWSRPTDATTASRVLPEQMRTLPPVKQTAPQLELPRQSVPKPTPTKVHLNRRELDSSAKPQPSDSPANAARPRLSADVPNPASPSQPTAPKLPRPADGDPQLADRTDVQLDRAPPKRTRPLPRSETLPLSTRPTTPNTSPSSAARRSIVGVPTVGDSSTPRPRRREAAPRRRSSIAGSTPVALSVAIARIDRDSPRLLDPMDSPARREPRKSRRQWQGIATTLDGPGSQSQADSRQTPTDRRSSDAAGMPDLNAISRGGRDGGSRSMDRIAEFSPAGLPSASDLPAMAFSQADSDAGLSMLDSLERLDDTASASRRSGGSPSSAPSLLAPTGGPMIDVQLPEGAFGLGDRPDPIAGLIPDAAEPMEIASLDFPSPTRFRRSIGGPITPAGSKIAAVESFSRRVKRTAGGTSPAPSGKISQQSEEAIERGLEYLASTQNEDGSWSLQGHGERVLLRSDTAATGLALLAFQGAGYTHRQHQYADNVGRGIEWLMKVQRTNGDLYRSEDPVSDRSVALYSHGIAALAMSEAYGMTQDDEIRDSAQLSLDFIANTQHRRRGGWRYEPQVSADTSVTGWMMMALKSGQLSGLEVPPDTYDGIKKWLDEAQLSPERGDRYRYDPFAPNTATQRHGRTPTPTMTAVGMLMRMYGGWRRENPDMQSASRYLLNYKPAMGTPAAPARDAYYWYYATQVMFHMGGDTWEKWNGALTPLLLESQVKDGVRKGSWDPYQPIEDEWSKHAGRMYVTTMNLLNLEVYYRHLPIYDDTAK